MRSPKISIIVPIYNVEKYLDRCLNSILNQSFKDIEIILVDDGSPDKSPEICNTYAEKDNRIKVIHKKNEGLGFARNSGIEIAKGEYIAFIDSDDYISPLMYEKLHQETLKHKYDIVYCGVNSEKSSGNFKEEHIYNETIADSKSIQLFLADIISSSPEEKIERKRPMAVWHAIYKKSLIDKYNIRFMSERLILSEDILFNISLIPRCESIRFIPYALYYHCLNSSSLSQTFNLNKIDCAFSLYEQMNKVIIEQNLTLCKLRAKRFIIGYARGMLKSIILSNYPQYTKKNACSRIYNYNKWKEIYYEYPINKMPLYHRIILFLIQKKAYRIQYFFFHLLNKLNII